MNTRRLLFLTLLTLTASAFLYMIAKKTNTTGTQRISLEEFSQWQKKNDPRLYNCATIYESKLQK